MDWPRQEEFSEPWMIHWLRMASHSLSVDEACRAAGVSLARYMMGRRRDLAFDEAALIVDQITDLMIMEAVRLKALDGDMAAVRIYFRSVRLPAFAPTFASWRTPAPGPATPEDRELPPHVVEAMLTAAMAAYGQPPPPPEDDD